MIRKIKKQIKDLQENVHNLNAVIGSLLRELGYSAEYNFEWSEIEGVKKIAQESEEVPTGASPIGSAI